ncbi:MAG: ribosome maturation factor RimM [Ruminococcaceae bacterium]|nr:ribosome maturation factor RimM [Oscillospiraceae bacterium]
MNLIEVGKIINTHGLRGEVKVMPWTDTPDVFEDLERVFIKNRQGEKELTIRNIKYQKNNLIIKFAELERIEEAELLKNSILLADREDLGELPEGVYYITDLIGLCVVNEEENKIGTLSDVLQTGANDVYVVKREGAKDFLIPVIDGVVLSVDLEAKKVTVRLMEGLDD